MSAFHLKAPSAPVRRTAVALGIALVAVVPSFMQGASAEQPTTDAQAAVETAAIDGSGTASDPAIWVHPTDPSKSLVLAATGAGGLEVYDMTGARVQAITGDGQPANVDVRQGVTLGAQTVDIVATAGAGALRFYTVDPATGQLTNATAGGSITPAWASGGGSIEGVCLYKSAGKAYAFATAPSGYMQQLELAESTAEPGKIGLTAVRGAAQAWDVTTAASSPVGGCVADDDLKMLYVSERNVGLWRIGAEPGDATTATSVDVPAPDGHLVPKVQGLAILETSDTTGYLIASSQGGADAADRDAFMVYRREGANEFVRTFHVVPGSAGDNCQSSIGIDAVSANLGASFPNGMFVCGDAHNSSPTANDNFKLVSAATIVDMTPPAGASTSTTTPTTPTSTTPTTAPTQTQNRSGYWMIGSDGKVYPFGAAAALGNADGSAVDIEPTPSGNGYWIVDAAGKVTTQGDAKTFGNTAVTGLVQGEQITSLSATKTGNGYWLFTTKGRVLPYGDALHYGDMSKVQLNGPVLDSIPTSSGNGYYMVASDGGIFSFGDAEFLGSMGDKKLNAPVQSLVPDGDNKGYWLVASDGGIFAFDAAFKGSMGDKKLNKPVTGMVRFGDGYLMVAEDGGIFNFSNRDFFGSLGANPPANPIVSVATLDVP